MNPIVAVIAPGMMGAAVAKRLVSRGLKVLTSLKGRTAAMIFEKPSLRTRVTFEAGMVQLGGEAINLDPSQVSLGNRESVKDAALCLSRWVDAIVIRTFSQQLLGEFATAARRLHVINALTDEQHPCQAIADFLTLQERWGSLRGRTIG